MKVQVGTHETFVGQGSAAWHANQPTILLLHGAGMDRTVWVLLARYLARHGWNVVVPDLPGHGASGGDALKSVETAADFIWQLMDELVSEQGLPATPLVFAGHSMGALIAMEAASLRADRISRLLLFGAGYPMAVGEPLLDAATANSPTAVDMITLYGHAHASRLGHNPVAGISVVNSAAALIARAAPGVLATDLAACHQYQGGEAAAANLDGVDATIIAGDEDRMTSAKGSLQLQALLKAHRIELEQCGHMMMSEQPEAMLRAVLQSLANPAPSADG